MDSGCSNHMTTHMREFRSMRPYEGNLVVVTAYNPQHLVKHIGDLEIAAGFGDYHLLHGVHHVPSMEKNLLSVSNNWVSCYVLFRPNYLKTDDKIKVEGIVVIVGRKVQSMLLCPN